MTPGRRVPREVGLEVELGTGLLTAAPSPFDGLRRTGSGASAQDGEPETENRKRVDAGRWGGAPALPRAMVPPRLIRSWRLADRRILHYPLYVIC